MAIDSGKTDQWQAALGGQSSTEEPLSQGTEDESVVRAEESTIDGQESEEPGDTQGDSQDTKEATLASSKPEAKSGTSTKEFVAVTDDKGQRRKIEIDYSDRAAIKKAHLEAAGMRKFQAERDQVKQRFQEMETKSKELENNWNALDGAYQNGGIEGLVDLLEGRRGAYKERVSKEVERVKFLERASPEEIEQLSAREMADKIRKDNERLHKDNEKFKKEITDHREATELKEVQSRVYPTFDKYNFTGKLGDEQGEQMFNEMLWTTSVNRLKQYEDKGLELSPELIDREFREVQGLIRKRISVATEKKVTNVIAQKKQEATENVQAKIKSGYSKSSDEEKLSALVKSGNTDAIFKNWSSFKNILGGRK